MTENELTDATQGQWAQGQWARTVGARTVGTEQEQDSGDRAHYRKAENAGHHALSPSDFLLSAQRMLCPHAVPTLFWGQSTPKEI